MRKQKQEPAPRTDDAEILPSVALGNLITAENELARQNEKYAKLWEERHDLRVHAQRLADALEKLQRIIERHEIVARNPKGEVIVEGKYLLSVQEAREALAQWEGDKQ